MSSAMMTGPETEYTLPVRTSSSFLVGAITAIEGVGAEEAGVEDDRGLVGGVVSCDGGS